MNLKALDDYLERCKEYSFEWGVHDCLTFSNRAFHVMYGEGWCDDWLGRYLKNKEPIKNDQLKEEFGFETLEEGVSSKLKKIDYVPPRGALVTAKMSRRFLLGQAFGICTGTRAVFIGGKGLVYFPIDRISNAWVKE